MQKRVPIKLSSVNLPSIATRKLAVTAIAGYQKFISPYKGFSCAHRVLYGSDSCSQYFKRVIAEEGILMAIANAKERFQECREANEILKSRRAKCGKRATKPPKYFASRISPNILAMESGQPENTENSENPETQDPDNPNNQESKNTSKKNISGSRWQRQRKQPDNNINNANNSNNQCDCLDFIDCANCADGFDGLVCDCLDVNNMNCPNLDCGGADCFSGLDCGNCGDCGSCGDFGSCN